MTAERFLLAALLFGAVVVAWSALTAAQERARKAAAHRCRKLDLQFLDESLVRTRAGLERGRSGRIQLVFRYRFEFSADGSRRHNGVVEVAGKQVRAIELEPWPEPGEPSSLP